MDQAGSSAKHSENNDKSENKNNDDILSQLAELRESIKLVIERQNDSDKTKRPRSQSPEVHTSPQKKAKVCQTIDPLDNLLYDSDESDNDIGTEDDDCLKDLQEFFGSKQQCGDKIDEQLANVVNDGLNSSTLDEEKLKTLCNKYPPPENCENLRVPKTNPEIWKNLSKRHSAKRY